MRIGCPKEIKNHEYRVGLTPESVRELTAHGHEVWVETGAGLGIGSTDADYRACGATIQPDAKTVFDGCEMIVKVKEPQAVERAMLREGQVLYTYLHLAPDPEQTADLVKSGVTAIAYETVTGAGGSLPLLKPMSQVAGRMSIQAGATALEKAHGGRGVRRGALLQPLGCDPAQRTRAPAYASPGARWQRSATVDAALGTHCRGDGVRCLSPGLAEGATCRCARNCGTDAWHRHSLSRRGAAART